MDYRSQSKNGKVSPRIANQYKRRNRMRSEQPYVNSPGTNALSEQEAVLKSFECIAQYVLAMAMEEARSRKGNQN